MVNVSSASSMVLSGEDLRGPGRPSWLALRSGPPGAHRLALRILRFPSLVFSCPVTSQDLPKGALHRLPQVPPLCSEPCAWRTGSSQRVMPSSVSHQGPLPHLPSAQFARDFLLYAGTCSWPWNKNKSTSYFPLESSPYPLCPIGINYTDMLAFGVPDIFQEHEGLGKGGLDVSSYVIV